MDPERRDPPAGRFPAHVPHPATNAPPPPPLPCHVQGEFPIAPPSGLPDPAPRRHRPIPSGEHNVWRPAAPERSFDPPQAHIEPPPLGALAEAASERRKRRAGMITMFLVVGGLVTLIVLAIAQAGSSALDAEVGDCLSGGADATDITKVDCGAPEATYTVVGKREGVSETDARLSACSEFADAARSYWEGKRGITSVGTVLCMKEIHQ